MDLLDRLLGHDTWTTRQLLDLLNDLSDDKLDRDFDIGHRTLRQTVAHVVSNIETWTDLMNEVPMRFKDSNDLSLTTLRRRYDVAVADFGKTARRLREKNKFDATYMDVLDEPPRAKSFGGTILHVLTHNHAHRTEVIHILTRLGVENVIEGDLLSWEAAQNSSEINYER